MNLFQQVDTVTSPVPHRSPNSLWVDLSEYTKTIFNYIIYLENINPSKVALRANIQKTRLAGDQILHCMMLIYFLLAYIIKQAFPGDLTGGVYVGLHTKQKIVTLVVRHNGLVLPVTSNAEDPRSQNLEFVCRLVEELRGVITMDKGPGNRFEIIFPSFAR